MSVPAKKEEPAVIDELRFLLSLLGELQEDIKTTRDCVEDVYDHFAYGSEMDSIDVVENLEFVYYGGDVDIGRLFDAIDQQMDKCQRLARMLV